MYMPQNIVVLHMRKNTTFLLFPTLTFIPSVFVKKPSGNFVRFLLQQKKINPSTKSMWNWFLLIFFQTSAKNVDNKVGRQVSENKNCFASCSLAPLWLHENVLVSA